MGGERSVGGLVDGARPDVGLDGQSVEGHLLGRFWDEGRGSSTKVRGGEGVHGLGSSGSLVA